MGKEGRGEWSRKRAVTAGPSLQGTDMSECKQKGRSRACLLGFNSGSLPSPAAVVNDGLLVVGPGVWPADQHREK